MRKAAFLQWKVNFMGQSPFAKKDFSQQSAAQRRRSTRIDYETPVVLSGRDSKGQPFREETLTLIVNIHGAKVRTSHQIMVGMLVTVESVRTGQGGKAVCVNVYDPSPEHPYRAIALQLIQPKNIWGLENPPLDWATVAAEMGGRTMPAEPMRGPAMPFKAPSSQPGAGPAIAASRSLPETQWGDFEQRATRLADSVHEKLRSEISITVRDALAVYEQRLATLVTEAEARISRSVEQAASEVAATIETLRSDAISEFAQDTLGEFQRRLGELSTEQEGRISQQAGRVLSQAEDRLAQVASKGSAQADSILASVEQRLNGVSREADRRLGERVEKGLADLGAALDTFRSDLDDKLAARRESAVDAAEKALRSRLGELSTEQEGRISQHAGRVLSQAEDQLAQVAAKGSALADSILASLEKRLNGVSTEENRRLAERVEKALVDLEAALDTFRSDLEDELTARRDNAVEVAEKALRARLAAILSPLIGPSSDTAVVPIPAAPAKK